jgi:uncharacterized membrane protein
MRWVGPGWVVAALCALLVLRLVFTNLRAAPLGMTMALACVGVAMGLTALYDQSLSVRLYPVFMNLAMLIAFVVTLVRGPSMIERLARLMEPDLPESGVRYTRKVTMVWAAFFVSNGAFAAWTALYADWRTWSLYNGLISYIAMGALFGGELIVRHFVRARAPA